jgi:hypothetical protein
VTAIPGERYYYDDSDHTFREMGRPSLAGAPMPPPPSGNPRDSLVRGTYVPGWAPDTVGVRDLGAMDVVQGDSNGIVTINSAPSNGISNTLFKGKVVCTIPTILKNCYLPNRQPEQVNTENTGNGGCLQNFGSNTPLVQLTDCTLNPEWWFNNGLSALKGSPLQLGVHGSNVIMNRCEIVNLQDGFECVSGVTQAQHDSEQLKFLDGQIHKAAYFNPWPTPPGPLHAPASNDTHSDAVQFNTAANEEIGWSMIGGIYDGVGYAARPAYNSGDDCHNSGFMLTQEGSTAANVAVTNIWIHDNWVSGGAASFNIFYKLGNTGSTWRVTDNKIARKGTGQPGGPGYYIYVSNAIQATITGNVIWDPITGSIDGTGVPAPIVRY